MRTIPSADRTKQTMIPDVSIDQGSQNKTPICKDSKANVSRATLSFADNHETSERRQVQNSTGSDAQQARTMVEMSKCKKWALLWLFSFSLFVDQWSYNSFFIFSPPISEELSIPTPQQSWIVTSYLITFGSTILLFGRVADLFPPANVFSYGFISLASLNLIMSFLPELYTFFIFRALSGIAGAALIPSAFKLISGIFRPDELRRALTIYTSAAPMGGASGVILAGVVQLIPNQGQMSAWRWFSRILAVIVGGPAIGSLFWIPRSIGVEKEESRNDAKDKLKKLDLGGSFLILAAVLLLILSLTMGGDHGFQTAYFIAPFLISMTLFPAFFWYESSLPEGYPLLAPSTFKIPNVAVFLFLGLILFSWWSVNNLALVNIYLTYRDEKAIIVGVRLLPQAITSIVVTLILSKWSWFTQHPKIAISTGLSLAMGGYALMSQSASQVGSDYWKFVFPPFIFGSGGAMMVYSATNVGVMTTVPPEIAGTIGGLLQVFFQVGASLALGIQAGLITINAGAFGNYKNVQASFYFEIGWLGLGLLVFLLGYRTVKPNKTDVETLQHGEE
ncbi:uncharacterized protein IL334_003895 [Kwoniella shivajii]|uniref:Major facilitator superfamily (MFS) profile domain-containing protein n=1 Tax=Kwoniella shivajii TaxID=564305 RepID=A0ABZ1CZ79_9TREE|nr:hypothetical protein IL334_003895 [Kwoniella shivajii]